MIVKYVYCTDIQLDIRPDMIPGALLVISYRLFSAHGIFMCSPSETTLNLIKLSHPLCTVASYSCLLI